MDAARRKAFAVYGGWLSGAGCGLVVVSRGGLAFGRTPSSSYGFDKWLSHCGVLAFGC